jgi:hypothetical protein
MMWMRRENIEEKTTKKMKNKTKSVKERRS